MQPRSGHRLAALGDRIRFHVFLEFAFAFSWKLRSRLLSKSRSPPLRIRARVFLEVAFAFSFQDRPVSRVHELSFIFLRRRATSQRLTVPPFVPGPPKLACPRPVRSSGRKFRLRSRNVKRGRVPYFWCSVTAREKWLEADEMKRVGVVETVRWRRLDAAQQHADVPMLRERNDETLNQPAHRFNVRGRSGLPAAAAATTR
jgi:hypothetical protein